MKLSSYIAFIFLFGISLFGYNQNWKLINEDEKFNYSLNGETFNTTVWVDSAKELNGDTIFYLNVRMKDLNPNSAFNKRYLDNQSTFLFGSHLYNLAGNITLSNDKDTIYLELNKSLNNSWLYSNHSSDSAKIISKTQRTIVGTKDSVKQILLSNGDSIILSKNFGIIKFPDIDSVGRYYELVGIEGRDSGKIVPKATEFFDFSVGDEFYYIQTLDTRWYDDTIHKRIIILSKTLSSDSVSYKVNYYERKIYVDHHFPLKDTIYIHDTAKVLVYDFKKYLNNYNLERREKDSAKNNGIDFKPIRIGYDTTFKCIDKESPVGWHCFDLNDTIIVAHSPVRCFGIHSDTTERYGKGFGLLMKNGRYWTGSPYDSFKKEKLIGSIKNGITYGEIPDTNIFTPIAAVSLGKSQKSTPNFKCYPNPANSLIYIETDKAAKIQSVSIIDCFGREIQSYNIPHQSKTKINVESLAKGYYTFSIIDSKNNIYFHKFLKN